MTDALYWDAYEQFLEFIKGFNLQTIVSLFLMMWYFFSHLETKMEKQAERTDRLYEMFIDLLKDGKKE